MTTNSTADTLLVEGMFCAACAASVEAVLLKHPGVSNAAVSFAADAAIVEWEPGQQDVDGLFTRIRELGYRPGVIGDAPTSDDQRIDDPQRYLGIRLIVAIFFGMWSMLPSIALYLGATPDSQSRFLMAVAAGILAAPVILYSGVPFYRMGLTTLKHGAAGIDALVTLGVGGAVLLSVISLLAGKSEVYFEVAIALITLQLLARIFDLRVRRRARDAVLGLLQLTPTIVSKIDASGQLIDVRLGDVTPGMRLRVFPGTRLAVDGHVRSTRGFVDRSVWSGESDPVRVEDGSKVHAGEQVLNSHLDIEVTAAEGRRRIDALSKQVRQFLSAKPPWQRIADTIARRFLLLSFVAAVIGAIVALAQGQSAAASAARALAVFVIACPCALSLAAPLTGLMASAKASRLGFVLRDLNALTTAARPDVICFDKTGTLTEGRPRVVAIYPFGEETKETVLQAALLAESGSRHPIASAIETAAAAYGVRCDQSGDTTTVAGGGVRCSVNGTVMSVGSIAWLSTEGVAIPPLPVSDATRAGVARDSELIGIIDLDDPLIDGVDSLMSQLPGYELELLSGDRAEPVQRIADTIGIKARFALSPEDKADIIRNYQKINKTVAFVGDGINDSVALAAADLGIAVGASTDAARTASAVAFVDADVTLLPKLLQLTTRTRRIIYQNLTWAVMYNGVAIPAAVVGFVHPAIAAVVMALSSVAILVNASRV